MPVAAVRCVTDPLFGPCLWVSLTWMFCLADYRRASLAFPAGDTRVDDQRMIDDAI